MFVIIAGGGRTGAQLTSVLLSEKHQVRVIEHRRELLARLHRELPTEVIYEGSPIDPAVLERAGIREAQVLAATTDTDANNLVLCYIAREMFKVPRIIARVNNPRHAWLFNGKLHVDVALNESSILAHLIEEEMSLGDMLILAKLHRGQYSLMELVVSPASPTVGVAIKDLGLPEQCVIAGIIHQGKMILPHGATSLQAADEVLVITDPEGAEQLMHLFTNHQADK